MYWGGEAGRFLSSRPVWSTKWVPGQPGLYKKTLSWKDKQKNKRTIVIQTKKQKQSWVDMWTDCWKKHRKYREDRKLGVTRTKDVSCRTSPVPGRVLKSIFLFSLSLSLMSFVYLAFLFFVCIVFSTFILCYFIIFSLLLFSDAVLDCEKCLFRIFQTHFPLSTPNWYHCWVQSYSV